jgi:hypothetical protein
MLPEKCAPMTAIDFIHGLTATAIPAQVRHAATRALLDTLGVAAAATLTDNSRIVRDFAATVFPGAGDGSTRLMFDGRPVTLPNHPLDLENQLRVLPEEDIEKFEYAFFPDQRPGFGKEKFYIRTEQTIHLLRIAIAQYLEKFID